MTPPPPGGAEPLPFESTYGRLPEDFYARVAPTPVAAPRLLALNEALAEELGLPPAYLRSEDGVAMLAGNHVPAPLEPLAMAYAGHQFGNWVPSLGDGRALLLGEVVGRDGVRRDVQLKGSGPTPFSRRGDGRAALGPVLREYVVSEGMAGLGIPSTRALAMVATGEPVYRERPEPGGVLARVARGHVRVGTFQYFHARRRTDAVRALVDYAIGRWYPDAAAAERPARSLLDAVVACQAELVARWMLVGFIHGVMNTDNTSIVGETIDFGPCAFMDAYHPGTVYSSIDHGGRYAYDQQPRIAHWNLARFAETLLPLLADGADAEAPDQAAVERAVEVAKDALEAFPARFDAAYHAGWRAKLGLAQAREGDLELVSELLDAMAEQEVDFTGALRGLASLASEPSSRDDAMRARFREPAAFDAWAVRWRERVAAEGRPDAERQRAMRQVSPAFIPRNHRVQQAIEAAEAGDLAPFERLLAVVSRPYDEHPEHADLARPPEPHEVVRQTFCGT